MAEVTASTADAPSQPSALLPGVTWLSTPHPFAEIMAAMATDVHPIQLADLQGLTLEQIAALDTTHEVLARILPDGTVHVPGAICPAI